MNRRSILSAGLGASLVLGASPFARALERKQLEFPRVPVVSLREFLSSFR